MNKIKLLIIDDNKNLVDMIREYFKDNKKIFSFTTFISSWDKRCNKSPV